MTSRKLFCQQTTISPKKVAERYDLCRNITT